MFQSLATADPFLGVKSNQLEDEISLSISETLAKDSLGVLGSELREGGLEVG